jgi:uncharacterized short protein YbdD (DUF466 family)
MTREEFQSENLSIRKSFKYIRDLISLWREWHFRFYEEMTREEFQSENLAI